ncbi:MULTISPECIES: DUF3592 domain-containing protein [Streptomyces]|uniref:DUF3592 domain-containing protein n=2 Tax=Streptomyces spororaveus TaxID=284039 RepID=A0ABQ3TDT2_9ACTN|nr:DUF3592 domain-containing protein [Streptomyces spororaveus]GHI78584.1 hypothetical protein Sspor_41450 [Streptomyces spororaveus]
MGREWFVSLIPLTLGMGFLAVGVVGLRHLSLLRRKGVTAVGRIVRHEAHKGSEGDTYYLPVAAWTSQDGKACEHRSRYGRGSVGSAFRVGATVTVRYDPENTRRFSIVGMDGRGLYLLFTTIGATFTLCTVTVLLVRLVTL